MNLHQLKEAYEKMETICRELERLEFDLLINKDQQVQNLFIKHLDDDLEFIIRKMRRVHRDMREIEVK